MIKNKLLLFFFAIILSYNSFSQDTAKYAIISFDRTEIDTGEVKEGVQVNFTYYFTNTGKAPLIFSYVGSGMGHMSARWPQEPVPPGKSDSIVITYNSQGRPGFFTKAWRVESNSRNNSVINLYLKGFVKRQE